MTEAAEMGRVSARRVMLRKASLFRTDLLEIASLLNHGLLMSIKMVHMYLRYEMIRLRMLKTAIKFHGDALLYVKFTLIMSSS